LALPVQADHIPDELKRRRQWVVWRYEWRRKDWAKKPLNPRDGSAARVNDPSTWGTFQEALNHHRQHGGHTDGVGYVVTEADLFTFIDLDDCYNAEAGRITSPDADILVLALDSYTEVSPSNQGVKVAVQGKLLASNRCRKKKGAQLVEIYDRQHFLALTGQTLPGRPGTIEQRQDHLEAAHALVFGSSARPHSSPYSSTVAQGQAAGEVPAHDDQVLAAIRGGPSGEQFSCLWAGDVEGYASPSEADWALASILGHYVGNDPARIERLMWQSGLKREKWERRDYLRPTIEKKLAELTRTGNFCRWPARPKYPDIEPRGGREDTTVYFGRATPTRPCPNARSRVLQSAADRTHFAFYWFNCLRWNCPVCSEIKKQTWVEALTRHLQAVGGPVYVWRGPLAQLDAVRHRLRRASKSLPWSYCRILKDNDHALLVTPSPLTGATQVTVPDAQDMIEAAIQALPAYKCRVGGVRDPVSTSRDWRLPRRRPSNGSRNWGAVTVDPATVLRNLQEVGVEHRVADPRPGYHARIEFTIPQEWSDAKKGRCIRDVVGQTPSDGTRGKRA
jgi:hypothetical protein